MGKTKLLSFWIAAIAAAVPASSAHAAAGAQPVTVPPQAFKVVLDPGHGGSDYGAIFKDGDAFFSEKENTLKLALEVERQLKLKGYPVLLTRSQDADIALNARTAIANREKASIFISLHMNSVAKGHGALEAEGIETYFLNTTTDYKSKRLAELENKGLDTTQGSKFTNHSEVNLILKDLVSDAALSESKRLACALSGQMVAVTRQKHRGVKQAMFVVLLGADMPSVLIEAGFVTSARDRKMMSQVHGLRAMAAAIVRAIDTFRVQTGSEAARQALGSCLVHGQG